MSPARWATGAVLVAACFLAAALAVLWGGGPGEPEGKARRPAPPSPEEVVAQARRADRYARWVLEAAPQDRLEISRARQACRLAVEALSRHPGSDEAVAASLKGAQLAIEGRRRERIGGDWLAYRQHKGLRDWSAARRDLRGILDLAGDPRDGDYRQARRLLDQIARR